MLRVQDASTRRTAQSRVLVLDAVLTQQAGVVPLPTGSCSTLDAYSAVLRSKEAVLVIVHSKPFGQYMNIVFLLYRSGTLVME